MNHQRVFLHTSDTFYGVVTYCILLKLVYKVITFEKKMIKQAKMKHHAHKIFFLLNHFVTPHKQHGDCYYVADSFVTVKLGSKENALMNCVYSTVELVDIKNLEFEDFVVDDNACNHCFWFPCVATLRPSWLGQGCTPMDGNNIIRKDRLVFMLNNLQWWIQDFPLGGRRPVGGSQPLTHTLFGKNVCENKRN